MDKKKIVGYSRIGKSSQETISMFETHIKSMITKRADCEFAGIYVDIGVYEISKNRIVFERMLCDAEAHKFDYIIVKSLSRFSRDKSQVVSAIKRLSECGVGVFFETESICTCDEKFKTLMAILKVLSVEENRLKDFCIDDKIKSNSE